MSVTLYRQMTRFDRSGIKLAHSTLLDWIAKTCILLNPLYEKLKQEVLQSNYLMMDETTMKVMDKSKREPPTGGISGQRRLRQPGWYSLNTNLGAIRKCHRHCYAISKDTFNRLGKPATKRSLQKRISLCCAAWRTQDATFWRQKRMIQKGLPTQWISLPGFMISSVKSKIKALMNGKK